MSAKQPHLHVYSRQGCPACEDMIIELDQALTGQALNFTVVEIDDDAQLVEKYGLRVPVLVWQEREICEHVLDYEVFSREVLNLI